MSATDAERWRVRLPKAAERPFRVFVNGVPQTEGSDYSLDGRELVFDRPLEKERLGFWRWTAIFFALFGTYTKNDSIDVQYTVGGRTTVATGLDIVAPGEPQHGSAAGSPAPPG
jgi:hypothetical protein